MYAMYICVVYPSLQLYPHYTYGEAGSHMTDDGLMFTMDIHVTQGTRAGPSDHASSIIATNNQMMTSSLSSSNNDQSNEDHHQTHNKNKQPLPPSVNRVALPTGQSPPTSTYQSNQFGQGKDSKIPLFKTRSAQTPYGTQVSREVNIEEAIARSQMMQEGAEPDVMTSSEQQGKSDHHHGNISKGKEFGKKSAVSDSQHLLKHTHS